MVFMDSRCSSLSIELITLATVEACETFRENVYSFELCHASDREEIEELLLKSPGRAIFGIDTCV